MTKILYQRSTIFLSLKSFMIFWSAFLASAQDGLNSKTKLDLGFMSLSSQLELGHVVAVALDEQQLMVSKRILLQVMTEERATGFATTALADGIYRIDDLGTDPWQIRKVEGEIEIHRPDAQSLSVQPLDNQGKILSPIGSAAKIKLLPDSLYYLITTGE
jgi:hypothetical protein